MTCMTPRTSAIMLTVGVLLKRNHKTSFLCKIRKKPKIFRNSSSFELLTRFQSQFVHRSVFCGSCKSTRMHLSPRELESLLIHQTGYLAQKRKCCGVDQSPFLHSQLKTAVILFENDDSF
jgi:hypothetical protein